MARSEDELRVGDWAVLALLAEEPTHGFAVGKALAPDGEIGKVWSVRRPLVYRAIDSLSEFGFAAPTGTVPSRSGPRRTVVAATEAGRAAVDAWLVEPVGHVRDARSLLMLKLLFLNRTRPGPGAAAQRPAGELRRSRRAAERGRPRRPTASTRC